MIFLRSPQTVSCRHRYSRARDFIAFSKDFVLQDVTGDKPGIVVFEMRPRTIQWCEIGQSIRARQ